MLGDAVAAKKSTGEAKESLEVVDVAQILIRSVQVPVAVGAPPPDPGPAQASTGTGTAQAGGGTGEAGRGIAGPAGPAIGPEDQA
jgi:hypothetical protein